MIMKKMLVLICAGAMALSLAACGSSGSGESGSAGDTEQTESKGEDTKEKAADADFQQVLVDNDVVKVEITGIEHSGLWGYTWNLSIDNKTEDTKLMVSMENVSVNGVMTDPFFATEVAAGKSAKTEVSWSDSDFETNGIEEVTTVEFVLNVSDSDNWDKDAFVKETMTVYPMGEAAAKSVQRESADTDMVLFDNDQCSMTIKNVDPDGFYGYTLEVYLENKTNKDLMFAVEDASINDIMCDPFWATTVAAGKSSHSEIEWFDDTLEQNGIEEVKTIDLPVRISEEENYETIFEETFTIDPSKLATK